MNASPHLLIFDSGAGGLSICREVINLLPGCRISYIADKAVFPYGLLDDDRLIRRVSSIIEHFNKEDPPNIVVIACNTASTVALPHLREHFDLPFVGVVPAIKPAAEQTQTGHIGLLATEATVNRTYTRELIDKYAKDCKVVCYGSQSLVELAENKILNIGVDENLLHTEIKNLLLSATTNNSSTTNKMDTVVLACTHFPLLLEEFKKSALDLQLTIRWIDSGLAIARRVEFFIQELELKISEKTSEVSFYFTGNENGDSLSRYYFGYLDKSHHYPLKHISPSNNSLYINN